MRNSSAMRMFFIKAFSFILGLSLVFNILGSAADRVAPLEEWRSEHLERMEDLHARWDQIEAVTLGNSHSDAIDYSVLGIEGQSLAIAAADLFEVEKYSLSLVDDKLPNLGIVFITISYYSFSRDNAALESFQTRRIGFYSMIPVWTPIPGDTPNFLAGKLNSFTHIFSVVRSDNWQGVWIEAANGASAESPGPYDGVRTVSEWGQCSHYTAEQLEVHAREIAGRNISSSNQMAELHRGLLQDTYDALARTIEHLQSKGIRVVLFTPTYYEKYTEYFAEDGSNIIENMYGMIDSLQQAYQVEFYDYSNDPEIRDHPELFYNSDHLSLCGHKVFTEKLLESMDGISK